MRLLFVAPEICSPVTEGRKRFILDLLSALSHSEEVFLLTTRRRGQSEVSEVPTRSRSCWTGPEHLLYLRTGLSRAIRDLAPEVVFHFPYGTFRYLYRIANGWIIKAIDRICSRRGVPCATVMYSIDQPMTLEELRTLASRVVPVSHASDQGLALPLGVNDSGWPERSLDERPPTILFLAGMWQPKRERVEHVIRLRGLGILLGAGASLSGAGVRLIAASPCFEKRDMREYVYRHDLNQWPRKFLELRGAVRVPHIYHEADLYIFPYHHRISQFIPTSILEAMLAGTPVVMSDLPFFRELAQGGRTAYVFRPGDEKALATVVLKAMGDPSGRRRIAAEARAYARERWSIRGSVEELRRIAGILKESGVPRGGHAGA